MRIKKITLIIVILLGALSLITLLMGGFMPLFSIAFGFLFIYYILIYITLNILSKRENKWFIYIIYLFFFIPIIWLIFDAENLLEFLLQGFHLDMK